MCSTVCISPFVLATSLIDTSIAIRSALLISSFSMFKSFPAVPLLQLQYIPIELICQYYLYSMSYFYTKIALCSGSGGSYLELAAEAGADAFVTGDVKHDRAVEAAALGITLIDAGHYETEAIILEPMREYLQERFPRVEFRRAESDRPPFRWE